MTGTEHPNLIDDVYRRAGFGGGARRGRRPALVVVDLQQGFTNPRFATGADMTPAVNAANLLLGAFHDMAAPVVLTQISYTPAELASGALPWLDKATGMRSLESGAAATELDPRIRTIPSDLVITKKGASAFFGTGLAHVLTAWQVDTAIVIGATTSGCVRATVVDSVSSGFPTLVVREGVADRAVGPHEAAMFDMQEKYGDVIGLAEALDYLSSLTTT